MKLLLILITIVVYAKDISGLKRYGTIVEQSIKDTNITLQRDILQNALKFVSSGKIIKGSCWDYINAVYNESNITKKDREVIFKSKSSGKYADKKLLKSGDWIYHINHSYHNIEHSGMFISWVDKDSNKALMLSYAGENKKVPARFRVYNIDKVYNIIRAKGVSKVQDYITLKEYAIKNKISIFNAMKLAKNGKIETVTKEINGKEQIFVKSSAKVDLPKPQKEPTIKELIEELEKLKQRVKILEDRVK